MKIGETKIVIHHMVGGGWCLGLERVQIVMECLGNPQKNLRFVHIAGANGKGSAVAMPASIF